MEKLTERDLELINQPGGDSIVRHNLLTEKYYSGYCGGAPSRNSTCSMPRTKWDTALGQWRCPECGWVSQFPKEFIDYYRKKWNK